MENGSDWPCPRACCFLGPQETGKTMIATLMKRNFYPITRPLRSRRHNRRICKEARSTRCQSEKQNSRSIIFIDETDGLLPPNNGFQSQHDIQLVEKARSLISELEPQHNVFLIETTH